MLRLSYTRRDFLRIGAFGTAFTLADQLRARSAFGRGEVAPSHKSAIMIFLSGGPSHLDTFDMKPGAPSEIRGEFRPIRTNASGISICEHLPLQAQIFDKLAVLRTITSPSEEHNDVGVMTGYSHAAVKAAGHPSFGAVVSKVRGMVRGMPAFMSLRGASVGCEPGILGMAHRPFTPSGGAADDLRLPVGVSAERRLEQGQLLRDRCENT